jgi:hypothetical protein
MFEDIDRIAGWVDVKRRTSDKKARTVDPAYGTVAGNTSRCRGWIKLEAGVILMAFRRSDSTR